MAPSAAPIWDAAATICKTPLQDQLWNHTAGYGLIAANPPAIVLTAAVSGLWDNTMRGVSASNWLITGAILNSRDQ